MEKENKLVVVFVIICAFFMLTTFIPVPNTSIMVSAGKRGIDKISKSKPVKYYHRSKESFYNDIRQIAY
ncbi:MAG: hypothetical protein ACOXZR_03090 [Bacilli bacterium]|jgi:hypothetical protein